MRNMARRHSTAKIATTLLTMLIVPLANAAEAGSSAQIPFADLGGITNWEADGDRGLYIQARDRKWYYASFMGPCIGLEFRDRVGFVTEPGGELDKFSSVLVGDQRCYFKSFAPSRPPAKLSTQD
jgi:hypothetical protein